MFLSQLAFGLPDTALGWIYEAIGILASLFVLISFIWSNEKITRIINMAGCIVFVVYAILIGSISVGVMNGACFILHVVKLIQLRKKAKKGSSESSDVSASETNPEQADDADTQSENEPATKE